MKLIFKHRQAMSRTAFSFAFQPVEPVSWIAGQSIRLEIPAADYGTHERRFTISSAPYEEIITITTRNSGSKCKQRLFSLQTGEVINGYGIQGNFSWGEADTPLFVAAGMGITPFYSMLKQRLFEQKPLKATLLYAHESHDAPFQADLDIWRQQYPDFMLSHIVNQRITAKSLHDIVPQLHTRIIFLAGPSAFVDQLKHELINEFQVDEGAIKGDWFTGNL